MATTLAVGAVAMAGCKDDGRTASQKVDDAANKAGQAVKDGTQKVGDAAVQAKDKVVANVTPSGSADATGMRGALEGIVQNALDNNNFKTMTNHLSAPDKARLEATTIDFADLNGAIDQFKKNWSAKYAGDSFGKMDADKVFGADFVGLAGPAGTGTEAEGRTGTATIKENHGMPGLEMTFVSQGGKWRLDVPDAATAETVKANLLKTVQDLNANTGAWPADKTEATRVVSQKVLAALLTK